MNAATADRGATSVRPAGVVARSRDRCLHVESAGAGPPVVLLHGWAMHGGLFAPVVARLSSRHRVHAVDLPGHGYSPPPAESSLDAVVAALDATLDALDDAAGADGEGEGRRGVRAPVALVGWSLGAAVALAYAHAHPDRVSRLALVGASPRFVAGADWPHAMNAETLARFGDELAVSWRHTLQRFLALQVHGSDHGRAALHALRHELFARGEPAPTVLRDALALLADLDLRPAVPAIAAPTLVIGGARDTLTPPGAGRWLAATLPNASVVEIAGAAHVPFLSHPDEFHAAMDAFLDGR